MSAPTEIVNMSGNDLRTPPAIPDHTLLRVIGRGSYGEVWEARNVMGTPRAVKIVRRQDFDSARPFEREFEGIQRYEPVSRTHAGLVHVLHVGMAAEGDSFYYVMELADDAGPENADEKDAVYRPKTLRSELHRRPAVPVEECIAIGMTLASALGHLHRGGLVHRDVKPSNIIFTGGTPKLADVGLVARLSDTRSMVGTEGYFAPEGTGQPRSDVYSLGKVLYECATGLDRMKFPDVPDDWGSGPEAKAAFEFMEIVLRAGEANPERRYKDTDEMLADLALLKAGKSLRYLRRMETRLKRTLQVLAFSALGIAVAGGAWYYERHRANQIESAEQTAKHAQQETQRLLGESLVAEARAVRHGGQAGAREKALKAVARGLKAGAPLRELRTEAASALALTDVGNFSEWNGIPRKGARTAVSPDGAYLASCAYGVVTINDRGTGESVALVSVPGKVADIALPRGADLLAVLEENRNLSLWNVRESRAVWMETLAGHPHMPSFSRDGDWAAFRTAAGLVARSSGGGETVVFVPDAPSIRHLMISPDGKWIAALPEPVKDGDKEKDLGFRIYSGLSGKMPVPADAAKVKTANIISDIRLEGPSISGDSRYLAAAVAEDRLRVWEMPAMTQVAWLRGHQRSVRSTAFHPHNSGIIASSSWDGTTRLWDIPTRRELLVTSGGGDHLQLLPDRGEMLLRTWEAEEVRSAPLSRASALRVLMLPSNTRLGLFSGMGFSPDGKLLSAAGDAGVIVWEPATGASHVVRATTQPQEWRDAVFDPTGTLLYSSGRSGLFRQTVSRDAMGALVIGKPEALHGTWCGDLDWAGDSLAVSGRWNADRKPVVELIAPDGGKRYVVSAWPTDTLAVSTDGRWLASADFARSGMLWDLKADPPAGTPIETDGRIVFGFAGAASQLIKGTDRAMQFLPLPGSSAPSIAPHPRRNSEIIPGRSLQSPDGTLVALSTGPTGVTLCDARTLTPLLTLDSPLTPFDCVMAFSPDSTKLALAGGVSRVVIWDLAWVKTELQQMGLGW